MITTIPEYVSEAKVPQKHFKALSDIDFLVLKVYKPYRFGWDDSLKKYRSFYNFPSRLTDEVVYSGDERAKIQEGDTFNLREKFWDDEAKKFGFRLITPHKGFLKTFKKVFDIDIAPGATFTYPQYDRGLGKEVDVSFGQGNTLTLQAVSSSKVISMIEALELDADVPLVDIRSRTGEMVKGRPYDFEDTLIDKLRGNFLKFKVRGAGMDTKYTFKEGKEFELTAPVKDINDNDINVDDIF